MCIAIYMGHIPLETGEWTAEQNFIYEVISRLLKAHPEEKFLLLSEEPVTGIFSDEGQMENVCLGKISPGILSLYRRFNHKIPAYLRHADTRILLSLKGVIPLKGGIPACLFLPDEAWTGQNKTPKEGFPRYRKRYLVRMLEKANQVAVLSHFSRQHLMSAYQIPEHKITVIGRGIRKEYQPLDWETREKVKEQYSEGKEYLLYAGVIKKSGDLLTLLKAFSVLKKKLNPGMILVLAGYQEKSFKRFPELLGTYQFRKEVKVTGKLSEEAVAGLVGAAYAQVFPSLDLNFSSSIPEALKCLTPVIAEKNSLFEEEAGGAALYFEPGDYQDFGAQLCEIYKKEEWRARLIVEAHEKAKEYSWEQASEKIWEAVQSALGVTKN